MPIALFRNRSLSAIEFCETRYLRICGSKDIGWWWWQHGHVNCNDCFPMAICFWHRKSTHFSYHGICMSTHALLLCALAMISQHNHRTKFPKCGFHEISNKPSHGQRQMQNDKCGIQLQHENEVKGLPYRDITISFSCWTIALLIHNFCNRYVKASDSATVSRQFAHTRQVKECRHADHMHIQSQC